MLNDYLSSLSSDMNLIAKIKLHLASVLSDPERIKELNFEKSLSKNDIMAIFTRMNLQFNDMKDKYIFKYIDINRQETEKSKENVICNYIIIEIFKNYLVLMLEGINMALDEHGDKTDIDEFNFQKSVRVKYRTAFLNFEIEKYMIDNNFEVSDNIFSNSKSRLTELNVDDETYSRIKRKLIISKSTAIIRNMLNIHSTSLEDNNNIKSLLLDYFNLRASLLMTDEEEIQYIADWFLGYTTSDEYEEKEEDNHISEEMIIKAFKNYDKDKEHYQELIAIQHK
jgi:hypothetical protein